MQVADNLGLDADSILPRQEQIERINGIKFAALSRVLAISCGRNDLANERLAAPAALAQLNCQPIEQLRMCRRLTTSAKILGRSHQALAEQFQPDLVSSYAGCQRVRWIDEPVGQIEASGQVRSAKFRTRNG